MCMPTVLATFQQTLSTSSTDWTFVPVSDVMPVAGVSDMQLVTEQYATTSDLRVQAARVFYEARTDRPGAWGLFTGQSNQSGDGDWTDSFDISTDAADEMYCRVGLAIKSNTAGNIAQGDFKVTIIVRQEGKIIGQRSFTLNPGLNSSSQTAYYPLSVWLPTLDLASLKGAFVIEAVSGTLKFRLAWRTADTDPKAPNAWQELDSFQTASSNTVYNTGNESVTFTDERWYQVGIAIQGQDGEGIIHMTASCALS
ncbi:MAG: hypothetical protein ACI8PZ_007583 [Myxococcota bacterium]|jgi:hypothetical protein